jgi:hypothetical protein
MICGFVTRKTALPGGPLWSASSQIIVTPLLALRM